MYTPQDVMVANDNKVIKCGDTIYQVQVASDNKVINFGGTVHTLSGKDSEQ